jgi:hypothetical protein
MDDESPVLVNLVNYYSGTEYGQYLPKYTGVASPRLRVTRVTDNLSLLRQMGCGTGARRSDLLH